MQRLTLVLLAGVAICYISWSSAQETPSRILMHPVESYVRGQAGLDLLKRDESTIAYTAWSMAKAGSQIGLGSCFADTETMPDVFVLKYSDTPERACGNGGLADTCRASRNNCITRPIGIFCDYDYLAPLHVLEQMVLSVNRAGAPDHESLSAEAMLGLARMSLMARQQRPYQRIADGLLAEYPWQQRGFKDNSDQILVGLAATGAVMFHELAHVEQIGCSLGLTDPRFTGTESLLEMMSCRLLPRTEVQADMRAMDAGAIGAQMVTRLHDDRDAAQKLFVRASMARLEYEAIVLPHPDYAIEVYTSEPDNRSELESYYFDAGANVPSYAGAGHIPPELRPIAAIRLLRERGYLTARGVNASFAMSIRLRAFLNGVLWKRCQGKENYAPEAVRDVINTIAFDKGPL